MAFLAADLPDESGLEVGHAPCANLHVERDLMYEGEPKAAATQVRKAIQLAKTVAVRVQATTKRLKEVGLTRHEKAMRNLHAKAARTRRQEQKQMTCAGRHCPKDPKKREEFLAWKKQYQSLLSSIQHHGEHPFWALRF